MIFEQLEINNYGVYKGKQSFDLTSNKKKPVVLIGALNGSGKTTFLHAVDFVLYGKFSNIFQSEGLSYENFLKKNINNENFDDGASIELKFHRRFKGKNQKFKIIRKWKENIINPIGVLVYLMNLKIYLRNRFIKIKPMLLNMLEKRKK